MFRLSLTSELGFLRVRNVFYEETEEKLLEDFFSWRVKHRFLYRKLSSALVYKGDESAPAFYLSEPDDDGDCVVINPIEF